MTVFKLTLTTLLVSTVVTGSAGAAAPAEPQWSWPLSPKPSVLRTFDPPDKPWLSGHRGVDLGPTHDGAPITAPSDGVVTFSGLVVDRPVLAIEQGNGLKSSFEPVTSELKTGDAVRKGQVIGTLEPGHCSSATCLHWGVRRGEDYVNPLGFVSDMRPSILLPLH
ncbi:peptidase M23 [Paenarthrobacter nitroguajacolicus]|uniref:M23 family metallopeptidase n=1 Tax=Paenarthrobacter nitroguajacolicus TaxID=211146 RepID=UPI0015B9F1E7|nr:M23 family metallopeptidase [Paenarthrobacter nitroguajacolicus]NWL12841.1 peptidase M23 [Paenarthrobacter nitroguajacolicus]